MTRADRPLRKPECPGAGNPPFAFQVPSVSEPRVAATPVLSADDARFVIALATLSSERRKCQRYPEWPNTVTAKGRPELQTRTTYSTIVSESFVANRASVFASLSVQPMPRRPRANSPILAGIFGAGVANRADDVRNCCAKSKGAVDLTSSTGRRASSRNVSGCGGIPIVLPRRSATAFVHGKRFTFGFRPEPRSAADRCPEQIRNASGEQMLGLADVSRFR